MILHVHVDVYVFCICVVGHGHGYTTYLFPCWFALKIRCLVSVDRFIYLSIYFFVDTLLRFVLSFPVYSFIYLLLYLVISPREMILLKNLKSRGIPSPLWHNVTICAHDCKCDFINNYLCVCVCVWVRARISSNFYRDKNNTLLSDDGLLPHWFTMWRIVSFIQRSTYIFLGIVENPRDKCLSASMEFPRSGSLSFFKHLASSLRTKNRFVPLFVTTVERETKINLILTFKIWNNDP